MFPLCPSEENRNYISGFLGLTEDVGWEHFPEIGQSLTWFMGCGVSLVDVFEDNTNKSAGFLQTCVDFLRVSAVETLTHCVHCQSVNRVCS